MNHLILLPYYLYDIDNENVAYELFHIFYYTQDLILRTMEVINILSDLFLTDVILVELLK